MDSLRAISVKGETRPDGARWLHFELPDGDELIITSKGKDLLRGGSRSPLFKNMKEYRDALRTLVYGEPSKLNYDQASMVRQVFNTVGKNSIIYNTPSSKSIVVKEGTSLASLQASMQRLDLICSAIEKHAPRWVSMPNHLMLYSHVDWRGQRPVRREYMVMERVNAGMNVRDAMNFTKGADQNTEQGNILKAMPNFSRQDRKEVVRLYKQMIIILRTILKKEYGVEGDKLLTDIKPENVLVERLTTPVAGERFKLSLIDQ